MTRNPTTRLNAAIDDYVMAVFREVIRLCVRRSADDTDDIAQAVAERFLTKAEAFMARYPEPARFARAATRNAGISFDRRERSQRGEGVRLVDAGNGLLTPRRPYLSGNTPIGEGGSELFDRVSDRAEPFHDQIVERQHDRDLLDQCLVGVSPADREMLLLVDGMGYTVHEVAGLIGQRRETVSRRVNRVRRRVDQNRVEMALSGRESNT